MSDDNNDIIDQPELSDHDDGGVIPMDVEQAYADGGDDGDPVPPPLEEEPQQPQEQPPLEDPQEFDLTSLGHVDDLIIGSVGIGVEASLYKIADYCKIYLKEQKRVLQGKLRRVAFGEPIDGMTEDDLPQALAYLTSRVEEIETDLTHLENILAGQHLSPEHMTHINRIYPPIYSECVERGTTVVEPQAQAQPQAQDPNQAQDRINRQANEMMNSLGLLRGFFDRIDNMGYNDPIGEMRNDEQEDEEESDSNSEDEENDNEGGEGENRGRQPRVTVSGGVLGMGGSGGNFFREFHYPIGRNRNNRRRGAIGGAGGVGGGLGGLGGLFNLPLNNLAGMTDVKVPLKISVVEQMPLVQFDESTVSGDKMCTVCFNEMKNGEDVRFTALCCNKYIHKKCAYEWWDKDHTCPICGKNLHSLNDDPVDEAPSNNNAPNGNDGSDAHSDPLQMD